MREWEPVLARDKSSSPSPNAALISVPLHAAFPLIKILGAALSGCTNTQGRSQKKEVGVSQRLCVARRLAGRKVGRKVARNYHAKHEHFLAEATPIINYVILINQQTIHVYTRTYTSLAS